MADRVRPYPPWWQDRFDLLDEMVDRYEDPEWPPASSWYDELDEPRIDSYWDEREEAANGH